MTQRRVILRRIVDRSASGEFLLECGHRKVVRPCEVIESQAYKNLGCHDCYELDRLTKQPRNRAYWLARPTGHISAVVRVDRFGVVQAEADIEKYGRSSLNRWYFVWAPNLKEAIEALKEGRSTQWRRTSTGCFPCAQEAE